ncbi:MAG: CBS domain-containing protein [Flavobacteriales bacterium]|nr:CBS domain-containing protein [Flavobacteriales bacterium]
MIAKDFISDELPLIDKKDKSEKVLSLMDEFKVSHLPLFDGGKYIGMIAESDVLDLREDEEIKVDNLPLASQFAVEDQHFYEVVKQVADLKLTAIAVLNAEGSYLGCIPITSIIQGVTFLTGVNSGGGIIILEVPSNDYSMTEIARVIESNGAKVLSAYASQVINTDQMRVTLKVNVSDIEAILQTFYRLNFNVTASYNQSEKVSNIKERYDSFMKYLEI